MKPLHFTGERFVPDAPECTAEIAYEHWHRYAYARAFAAGKRVLDLACGEGYGAHFLAEVATSVVGVDLDAETIAHARARYSRPNLDLRVGSIASLPIEGRACFDLVTSFETIEHVDAETQRAFLAEVKRVLSEDGIFLVSSPDKRTYSDERNYRNPFHVHELQLDELRALLGEYFAHVQILAQGLHGVSSLHRLDVGPGPAMDIAARVVAADRLEFDDRPPSHLYLVAVCSQRPLGPIATSILFDRTEGYLDDRVAPWRTKVHSLLHEIDALHDRLREKDVELTDLRAKERSFVALQQSFPTREYAIARAKVDALRDRVERSPVARVAARLRGSTKPSPEPPVPTPTLDVQAALEEMRTAPLRLRADATPTVSIVIPVYNKVEYTWACLKSIVEQCAEERYEVIVVDDGSSDATLDLATAAVGVRLLRNPTNLGFVGTCNRGAAEARGEYIVFLNNDTQVHAGWLRALLATFDARPDAGLVGSKLIYPDGRLQEAGGIVFRDGSAWNYGRLLDPSDDRVSYLREVDYVSGASIMLPRSLFEQLGGFDVEFAPCYYEDTDLAMRVRAAGRTVWMQPLSTLTHYEGITAGTDVTRGQKKYQVVNQEKFFARWREALATHGVRGEQIEHEKERRVKRRALVVDSYVPLPDQDSGSVRMDRILGLIQRLGHKVTFMPDNGQCPQPYTDALRGRGIEVLTPRHPDTLRRHLEERGDEYDVVMLSRVDVAARHLEDVRALCPTARVAFDTVDLHHLREQRTAELSGDLAALRDAARRKVQELSVADAVDVTVVVSPLERAVLASERPFLNVEIVSNVHTLRGRRAGFDARQDILFVGGFQHPPNVDGIRWFVSEVWPLVRRELPEARLHIAGSNTPVEVTSLASDSVIVHGWVPDLDPLLDRARVSVAPLRVGAGVKGKINQAMSYGLPVVATSIAVEGMNLEQERQVLIADAPDAFARALTRLYLDGELWARLSDGGLENVRTCFSDTVAEAALRRVIAPNLPSRARLFALDVSGMTELLGAARTSPTQSILIDPFTHEPDRVRVDSIARASLRPDAPTVFGRPIVVAQLGERPPVQASVERLRGHLASAGIGDAFLIGYDGRGMRSPTSMSSGIDAIATREPPLTSAARAEAWVSSRVQRLRRRGVPTPTAKPVSSPLMPRSIPVIDVDVEGALDRLRATIAELRGRVPEARIVFLIGARSLAQRFADELARSWSEAAAARVPAQLRSPDSDGVAPPLSIRR